MVNIIENANEVLYSMELYDENEEIQEALLRNIDSYKFIQLIVALESAFEIGIPDEHLYFEFFGSRESIYRVIKSTLDA